MHKFRIQPLRWFSTWELEQWKTCLRIEKDRLSVIIRPYGARALYVWYEEYLLAFWLCPFLFLAFWFYKQKGSNNYTKYFLKHNTLPDISEESPNRHLLPGGHFPPWAPAGFLSTPFPPLPLPASICPHCSAFMRSSLRTRPSPICFHAPKLYQHQAQKKSTWNFRIRSSCPRAPPLGSLFPGLPKP